MNFESTNGGPVQSSGLQTVTVVSYNVEGYEADDKTFLVKCELVGFSGNDRVCRNLSRLFRQVNGVLAAEGSAEVSAAFGSGILAGTGTIDSDGQVIRLRGTGILGCEIDWYGTLNSVVI